MFLREVERIRIFALVFFNKGLTINNFAYEKSCMEMEFDPTLQK